METHFPQTDETKSQLARERVMTDLRTLATDAESLLKATASDASDKAKEARTRLSAALEKARATYDDLQTQSVASAKAALRKADDTVRTHPYESIGIAFGFGLLLGALLRRK